jgi:CHAT domain-containing protein
MKPIAIICKLGCALALAFTVLNLSASAQTLNEVLDLGQVVNADELRKTLEQLPPVGASQSQLADFYREQDSAAWRLNDTVSRVRILKNWVRDVPDGLTAKWNLWRVLMTQGSQFEGLELGESVVRAPMMQRDKVRAESWLASDYVREGDWHRAEELLENAEKIILSNFAGDINLSDASFFTSWARMLFYLAGCELSLEKHKFDKARDHCALAEENGRRAVSFGNQANAFERHGAESWHVHSAMGLAKVALGEGRPFDADLLARRAMSLSETYELGREQWFSFFRHGAKSRIIQHDFVGAERFANEGLKLAEGTQNSPAANINIGLKSLLLQSLLGQGRWKNAQDLLDSLDSDVAGNESAQRLAGNVHERAVAAIMSGNPIRVISKLQEALASDERKYGADHMLTALTRGLLGIALADTGVSNPEQSRNALQELARAVSTILEPSSLGEEYDAAGLRRLYRRMILEKYLELASNLPPSGADMAAIFRVADFLRGSSVQRALSEAAARSAASSEMLADVVRRDQDAMNELRGLYAFIAEQSGREQQRRVDAVVSQMRRRINVLEGTRRILKQEIAKQFPQYDRLVNPKPPSPAEVAQRLSDGEVFVSILPTQKFVYVWTVGKEGVGFHRANLDDAHLRELVQRIRKTLDVAEIRPFDQDASSALYAALFQPLSTNLQSAHHWIVAPGGVLGQLPMGVLLTTSTPVADVALLPWLIRNAAFTQVASASAWMSIKQIANGTQATEWFAAWGDPLFDRDRLQRSVSSVRSLNLKRLRDSTNASDAPQATVAYRHIPALPETRLEIEAIAASLGVKVGEDVYFGERATRESVLNSNKLGMLSKKRVLVFATHGLIPGDLPNLTQPALALAANGDEVASPLAPLLTLEDVLTLKLNADWVVLSACNTAAADGKAEEALSGLARGFFYAGSRSLLVTHWAVESESAKLLTTNTFAHYTAHPEAPKAESLRQAMLQVMEKPEFAHPAYWAPYALVGDGGR